jgi:hypothetical protein
MLFKQRQWEGLADGSITLAFRRWRRPQARTGSRLRMAAGVLMVDAVDVVSVDDINEEEAHRAGAASVAELVAQLDAHQGDIYRVAFHFAGPDPRVELRQSDVLSDEEIVEVRRRLARLDARSPRGPWTIQILRLIDQHPGVRAGDLAESLQRERLAFKADVRKLKELGLTESLKVGYRLSPRGRVVLDTV